MIMFMHLLPVTALLANDFSSFPATEYDFVIVGGTLLRFAPFPRCSYWHIIRRDRWFRSGKSAIGNTLDQRLVDRSRATVSMQLLDSDTEVDKPSV
jgi:hypothetical protein